jgi:caffeoyl-CoA O-methyltransferase
MEPIEPKVDAYAEARTTPRPSQIDELDARTREELGHDEMLSGPVVARLLGALVAVGQPEQVLEIGTFSGTSALAMAAELPPGGRLITLEADPEHAAFARAAFASAPHGDRIELIEGPALETLERLDGPFGVVFVDAHKPEYRAYVEAVLPKLATDGIIAVDNTLFSGQAVDRSSEGGESLDDFNRWLLEHPDLITVLLTVRDGVTLVRRRR